MGVVAHAERAVLGGVLHDGRQLERVTWLAPSDFVGPYRRAAWAAMLDLARRGEEVTPDAVRRALPGRVELAEHRARDAVPLIELMGAAVRADRTPLYGAMVLEASLRRHLRALGEHLEHAARSVDPSAALGEADAGEETVRQLASRWQRVPDAVRHQLDAPTGAPDVPELRTPVVHELRNREASTDRGEAQQETADRLIGSLVAGPCQLDHVSRWLSAEDFADPDRGRMYRTVAELHHEGQPVDELTALWAAHRAGVTQTWPADELYQALRDGLPGAARADAAAILDDAVLARVDRTGGLLQDLARDPRQTPSRLLDRTRERIRELEDCAERLERSQEPARPVEAVPAAAPSPRGVVDLGARRGQGRQPGPDTASPTRPSASPEQPQGHDQPPGQAAPDVPRPRPRSPVAGDSSTPVDPSALAEVGAELEAARRRRATRRVGPQM